MRGEGGGDKRERRGWWVGDSDRDKVRRGYMGRYKDKDWDRSARLGFLVLFFLNLAPIIYYRCRLF